MDRKSWFEAARWGKLEVLQAMHNEGDPVDIQDADGTTAMMKCAYGGYFEAVTWLHSKGANIHSCDDCGQTVLDYAQTGRNARVIEYLRKAGAMSDGAIERAYAAWRVPSDADQEWDGD